MGRLQEWPDGEDGRSALSAGGDIVYTAVVS